MKSKLIKSDNKTAIKNDLPPWQINLPQITNVEDQKEAERKIDIWIEKLQKDIYDLFSKNGIQTYQMSFVHEGSKIPLMLKRGSNYMACKLATESYKVLKNQVDNELSIIQEPNQVS